MRWLLNPFWFAASGGSEPTPPAGVMLSLTADITGVNTTGGYVIPFDDEQYDDDGWHDNATNNTRMTAPAGFSGHVLVRATIYTGNASATANNTLVLRKNGSSAFDGVVGSTFVDPTVDSNTSFSLASGPIPAVAGDYFEVVFTGADASIDILSSGTFASIQVA